MERARYEAQLTERRYKAVDPDNRVVARTLENDWEDKLRELETLEEAYALARRVHKVELSDADRREILTLATDLPRVWRAATTTNVQKKQLLRMLVQQIAPHIHHWDRSAIFSVDKLRRDCGWEPELSFPRAVERTWRWYQSEGLPESQSFSFAFEDELISLVDDFKP